MLRTIDRYVIRETIPPFLLSLVIFTFLLEIPPVMRDLEMLVAKGVSWPVAGRIVLTLIPQALGLTIPMALLTGLLIGLGRLSSDRETVALLACGVSPHRLLRPVLVMATIAAGATLYVMIKALPDANQTFREITFDVIAKQVENDVRPRVFFENFPGWVLYARDEPADRIGWKEMLVADTSKLDSTELFLASRGRLVVSRQERRVDLVLTDGTQYTTGKPGETRTHRFPGNLTMALNPESVFQKADLPRGLTEKTIADLRADMHTKLTQTPPLSPHPEIIFTEQKFSVPFACFVFGIIGLALGLSVSRDGKMGGFVIGIAVIFAYYVIMYLAEAQTQGHYRAIETARKLNSANFALAHLARWWPNIILGLFGIGALVWRDRFASRQFPRAFPIIVPQLVGRWRNRRVAPESPSTTPGNPSPNGRKRNVVVVVRVPKLKIPSAGLIDQYVSRMYLRMVALAFLALVGLFYISTFIDASDKLFKGTANGTMIMTLLVYRTPQFVYFVIPIAALLSVLVTFGLLSRTSELTVMKACGISLYRVALPIVLLSLLFSAALFALDQEVLARANRRATAIDDQIRGRPPKTFNPLNRRWMIGRDGSIYHYGHFDPRHETLTSLSVYRLVPGTWRLASQTYSATAEFRNGWTGVNGWSQDFTAAASKGRTFTRESLPLEPPEYFKTEDTEADLMTVAQLRRTVRELAATGANVVPQQVDLQRKLAFPFVTFVMTLLAVPFGVTTGRRGALYGIGLGIVLALTYWLLMSVFVAIGKAGLLPPILSAWTPNIIVSAAAIYLLLTTKT
ncbi:MAG TPA: LptF/LptG family permease [Vicinamibacterales bacterium]|nr:LptF/LptG family permease [Vicinamibacterales bacterium]